MNHKAIRALYSNVVTIDDGTGAFDAQGNQVTIDMSAVNAWVDPEAYKTKRQPEYPPRLFQVQLLQELRLLLL